jgi:hypothetical protein
MKETVLAYDEFHLLMDIGTNTVEDTDSLERLLDVYQEYLRQSQLYALLDSIGVSDDQYLVLDHHSIYAPKTNLKQTLASISTDIKVYDEFTCELVEGTHA